MPGWGTEILCAMSNDQKIKRSESGSGHYRAGTVMNNTMGDPGSFLVLLLASSSMWLRPHGCLVVAVPSSRAGRKTGKELLGKKCLGSIVLPWTLCTSHWAELHRKLGNRVILTPAWGSVRKRREE